LVAAPVQGRPDASGARNPKQVTGH
jgi:hypothetical protein